VAQEAAVGILALHLQLHRSQMCRVLLCRHCSQRGAYDAFHPHHSSLLANHNRIRAVEL
jgi:hypothetical protein